MTLPKKIAPCPIKEAIIEIRFETRVPQDAVFGLIYGAVQEEYSKVESLPILELPEVLRSNDENLAYKPYYRLAGSADVLLVGPRVFALAVPEPYPGWQVLSRKATVLFSKLKELNAISQVTRFALRYSNFFALDIFDVIRLSITLDDQPFSHKNTFLRAEIPEGIYTSTLQISNDAALRGNGPPKKGSIIDIDTFSLTRYDDFFSKARNLLDEAHNTEKELFFGLLAPNFLASLNPTY